MPAAAPLTAVPVAPSPTIRVHGVTLRRPRPAKRERCWRVEYRDPMQGGRRVEATIPDCTDERRAREHARRLAERLKVQRAEVTLQGEAYATGRRTLEAEIAHYLEAVTARVGKTGRATSPATLRNYRDALTRFAEWMIATRRTELRHLTRAALSEWRTSLRTRKGGTRRTSTVNQTVKPVRQMLLTARLEGRLDGPGALDTDAINGALKRLNEPSPVPRCFTVPEIRKSLSTALSIDSGHASMRRGIELPPAAPAIAVGLLTGMRRDELVRVTVGEVLFGAPSAYDGTRTTVDAIRLPAHKVKTGKGRDVRLLPYSPLLFELLAVLTEGRDADAPLLGLTYEQLGNAAERIKREGGPRDFNLKALRSTCATYQSPLPGNAKAKADRLGHTLTVAERHYLQLPEGTPDESPSLDAVMQLDGDYEGEGGVIIHRDELRRIIDAAKARAQR
jgi:integrase